MAFINAIFSIFLIYLITENLITVDASTEYYTKAIVESCKGCRLKSLPDVKKFIFDDVPLYNNVVFQHIQGAPPELVLFGTDGTEVERLKLSHLTREECNNLLITKGFTKKPNIKDEI